MSLNLKYPGVYIQELPSGVHPIMGVSTSLTAFVGEASFGPVNEPTLINSFADFERIFGGLNARLNLGYAVSQYFANGGQQAIVVRVVGKNAKKAQFEITDATGKNMLTLEAKNEGSWANSMVDKGNVTTYTDDVKDGQVYYYMVAAVNSIGTSVQSSPAQVSLTPLDRPTGLTAKAVSPTAVNLAWTAPANNGSPITGYKIEKSLDETNWTTIVSNTANALTTFSDTGLNPGTKYYYRVSAINGFGTSATSVAANDTTQAATKPNPPPNLSVIFVSPATVNLTWTAPANNGSPITGYKIERESPVGNGFTTLVANTGNTATSYSDSGLTPATQYNYRVSAINGFGTSDASNSAAITTQQSAPDSPTGLTATAVSRTQVNLTWTAPANNGSSPITGYKIERESPVGNGFTTLVANTGNTATSYSDSGLTPATQYNYRVSAINGFGTSATSVAANDTTQAATKPNPPPNLSVIFVSPATVNLTWTAPANNGSLITGYKIERESPVGNGFTTLVANTGNTATSYSDSGLTPATQYNYRVSAINGFGTSDASNSAAITTQQSAPDSPTGLTATAVSRTQVNLTWTASANNGSSNINYYIIYRSTEADKETSFKTTGEVIEGLKITANNNTRDSTDQTLFNLIVTNVTTGVTETFLNLSSKKTAPQYVENVLRNDSNLVNLVNSSPPMLQFNSSPPDSFGSIIAEPNTLGVDDPATAQEVVGDENAKTGMYALKNADIFNLLCIPPYGIQADNVTPNTDIDYTDILDDVVAFCNGKRAIFLVDAPTTWESVTSQVSDIQLSDLGSISFKENAAIFFPRVNMADPLNQGRLREFVPCGAIAGTIARIDGQRGVWKAPAGIDATVGGVISLSYPLTDGDNGVLNPQGINCLRSFPEIGSIIWGSRTLKGADILADQWKYLPIRRLALYIEESLRRGTQWVVFEPNDEPLWSQIRLNVGSFMQDLFRKGAFQGSTPKEAYFVRCDSTTTTSDDQDKGIVNILVGFAPLKPAEFVVIQIQQIAGQGAGG